MRWTWRMRTDITDGQMAPWCQSVSVWVSLNIPVKVDLKIKIILQYPSGRDGDDVILDQTSLIFFIMTQKHKAGRSFSVPSADAARSASVMMNAPPGTSCRLQRQFDPRFRLTFDQSQLQTWTLCFSFFLLYLVTKLPFLGENFSLHLLVITHHLTTLGQWEITLCL